MSKPGDKKPTSTTGSAPAPTRPKAGPPKPPAKAPSDTAAAQPAPLLAQATVALGAQFATDAAASPAVRASAPAPEAVGHTPSPSPRTSKSVVDSIDSIKGHLKSALKIFNPNIVTRILRSGPSIAKMLNPDQHSSIQDLIKNRRIEQTCNMVKAYISIPGALNGLLIHDIYSINLITYKLNELLEALKLRRNPDLNAAIQDLFTIADSLKSKGQQVKLTGIQLTEARKIFGERLDSLWLDIVYRVNSPLRGTVPLSKLYQDLYVLLSAVVQSLHNIVEQTQTASAPTLHIQDSDISGEQQEKDTAGIEAADPQDQAQVEASASQLNVLAGRVLSKSRELSEHREASRSQGRVIASAAQPEPNVDAASTVQEPSAEEVQLITDLINSQLAAEHPAAGAAGPAPEDASAAIGRAIERYNRYAKYANGLFEHATNTILQAHASAEKIPAAQHYADSVTAAINAAEDARTAARAAKKAADTAVHAIKAAAASHDKIAALSSQAAQRTDSGHNVNTETTAAKQEVAANDALAAQAREGLRVANEAATKAMTFAKSAIDRATKLREKYNAAFAYKTDAQRYVREAFDAATQAYNYYAAAAANIAADTTATPITAVPQDVLLAALRASRLASLLVTHYSDLIVKYESTATVTTVANLNLEQAKAETIRATDLAGKAAKRSDAAAVEARRADGIASDEIVQILKRAAAIYHEARIICEVAAKVADPDTISVREYMHDAFEHARAVHTVAGHSISAIQKTIQTLRSIVGKLVGAAIADPNPQYDVISLIRRDIEDFMSIAVDNDNVQKIVDQPDLAKQMSWIDGLSTYDIGLNEAIDKCALSRGISEAARDTPVVDDRSIPTDKVKEAKIARIAFIDGVPGDIDISSRPAAPVVDITGLGVAEALHNARATKHASIIASVRLRAAEDVASFRAAELALATLVKEDAIARPNDNPVTTLAHAYAEDSKERAIEEALKAEDAHTASIQARSKASEAAEAADKAAQTAVERAVSVCQANPQSCAAAARFAFAAAFRAINTEDILNDPKMIDARRTINRLGEAGFSHPDVQAAAYSAVALAASNPAIAIAASQIDLSGIDMDIPDTLTAQLLEARATFERPSSEPTPDTGRRNPLVAAWKCLLPKLEALRDATNPVSLIFGLTSPQPREARVVERRDVASERQAFLRAHKQFVAFKIAVILGIPSQLALDIAEKVAYGVAHSTSILESISAVDAARYASDASIYSSSYQLITADAGARASKAYAALAHVPQGDSVARETAINRIKETFAFATDAARHTAAAAADVIRASARINKKSGPEADFKGEIHSNARKAASAAFATAIRVAVGVGMNSIRIAAESDAVVVQDPNKPSPESAITTDATEAIAFILATAEGSFDHEIIADVKTVVLTACAVIARDGSIGDLNPDLLLSMHHGHDVIQKFKDAKVKAEAEKRIADEHVTTALAVSETNVGNRAPTQDEIYAAAAAQAYRDVQKATRDLKLASVVIFLGLGASEAESLGINAEEFLRAAPTEINLDITGYSERAHIAVEAVRSNTDSLEEFTKKMLVEAQSAAASSLPAASPPRDVRHVTFAPTAGSAGTPPGASAETLSAQGSPPIDVLPPATTTPSTPRLAAAPAEALAPPAPAAAAAPATPTPTASPRGAVLPVSPVAIAQPAPAPAHTAPGGDALPSAEAPASPAASPAAAPAPSPVAAHKQPDPAARAIAANAARIAREEAAAQRRAEADALAALQQAEPADQIPEQPTTQPGEEMPRRKKSQPPATPSPAPKATEGAAAASPSPAHLGLPLSPGAGAAPLPLIPVEAHTAPSLVDSVAPAAAAAPAGSPARSVHDAVAIAVDGTPSEPSGDAPTHVAAAPEVLAPQGAITQDVAATRIQALFRGHSVRKAQPQPDQQNGVVVNVVEPNQDGNDGAPAPTGSRTARLAHKVGSALTALTHNGAEAIVSCMSNRFITSDFIVNALDPIAPTIAGNITKLWFTACGNGTTCGNIAYATNTISTPTFIANASPHLKTLTVNTGWDFLYALGLAFTPCSPGTKVGEWLKFFITDTYLQNAPNGLTPALIGPFAIPTIQAAFTSWKNGIASISPSSFMQPAAFAVFLLNRDALDKYDATKLGYMPYATAFGAGFAASFTAGPWVGMQITNLVLKAAQITTVKINDIIQPKGSAQCGAIFNFCTNVGLCHTCDEYMDLIAHREESIQSDYNDLIKPRRSSYPSFDSRLTSSVSKVCSRTNAASKDLSWVESGVAHAVNIARGVLNLKSYYSNPTQYIDSICSMDTRTDFEVIGNKLAYVASLTPQPVMDWVVNPALSNAGVFTGTAVGVGTFATFIGAPLIAGAVAVTAAAAGAVVGGLVLNKIANDHPEKIAAVSDFISTGLQKAATGASYVSQGITTAVDSVKTTWEAHAPAWMKDAFEYVSNHKLEITAGVAAGAVAIAASGIVSGMITAAGAVSLASQLKTIWSSTDPLSDIRAGAFGLALTAVIPHARPALAVVASVTSIAEGVIVASLRKSNCGLGRYLAEFDVTNGLMCSTCVKQAEVRVGYNERLVAKADATVPTIFSRNLTDQDTIKLISERCIEQETSNSVLAPGIRKMLSIDKCWKVHSGRKLISCFISPDNCTEHATALFAKWQQEGRTNVQMAVSSLSPDGRRYGLKGTGLYDVKKCWEAFYLRGLKANCTVEIIANSSTLDALGKQLADNYDVCLAEQDNCEAFKCKTTVLKQAIADKIFNVSTECEQALVDSFTAEKIDGFNKVLRGVILNAVSSNTTLTKDKFDQWASLPTQCPPYSPHEFVESRALPLLVSKNQYESVQDKHGNGTWCVITKDGSITHNATLICTLGECSPVAIDKPGEFNCTSLQSNPSLDYIANSLIGMVSDIPAK